MDQGRLQAHLEEGLSLEQIGQLEGKHPSTIAYWLKRYGLEANGKARHAPRGGVDRDRLSELVERGTTLREIAEEIGVSMSTVRYWIKRHQLQRPHDVRRRDIDRASAEGRRTLLRECAVHGWTTFVIENSGRTRCRRCRMNAVSEWRRRTKAKLVAEAGGCCSICGYDRHQAALQFHHLDPAAKEFHLAANGVTRSIDALRREAGKCVLLCANCHAEVEAGAIDLESGAKLRT